MVSYRVSLALACLLVLGVNASAQTITIFEASGLPATIPEDGNIPASVALENVPDPVLDDGEDDIAIQVSNLSAPFNNINTGFLDLPTGAAGSRFRLSFDYLIPEDTALSDEDVLFAQISVDGDEVMVEDFSTADMDDFIVIPATEVTNRGSQGFFNVSAASVPRGVWQTLSVTALNFPTLSSEPDAGELNGPNLPEAATQVQGFFQIVDGGFGGTPDFPADGIALLVDNIRFEVFENITDGDFNGDGIVNASDYTVFRDNAGAASDALINNAGNGFEGNAGNGFNGITVADLAVFQSNFGTDNSGGTPQVTAVPEPGALALVLGGLAGVAAGRRRR